MRSLTPKPDALWLAPDPGLITPASFQTIKQFSWDNAIPFYAPTAGLAAAGAAAAVSISSPGLGHRRAELSRQALSGSHLPGVAYSEKTEAHGQSGLGRQGRTRPHARGPRPGRQGAPVKLQNKFLALLLPAGLIGASLIVILIRRSVHKVILSGLERNVSTVALTAEQSAVPDFESARESFFSRSSKRSRTGRERFMPRCST